MPYPLQSSTNPSSKEHRSDRGEENALCVNGISESNEHTAFTPLVQIVGSDGVWYEPFDAYIASMPPKNCDVVPDERFKRFVRVLRARTYQVTILHSWKGTVRSCSTQRSLDRKHRMARASRSVPGYYISVLICALASAYNGPSVKTHTRVGSKR
jgi:hypothetical protein